MHTDEELTRIDSKGRVSLRVLVGEAQRQLDVCNACRYCEGLCAVFPALERRTVLALGDITQIANLCHDCRACFDACMYSEPHEFAVNIPRALAAVRLADYQRYVWPRRLPALLRGRLGLVSGSAGSVLLLLAIAVVSHGWSALGGSGRGTSPYSLVPYGALLVIMLAAAGYSVVVTALGIRRFWWQASTSRVVVTPRAWARSFWYAATLRHMRGGGVECYYPEDERPSGRRRHLHGVVAYGFGLCVLSTTSAGVLQDLMGDRPPYPVLSVPVLAGLLGGFGLLVGSLGLIALKTRSSSVTSIAEMTVKDYWLLSALAFLAISGLLTLLLRDTSVFGLVLLVHLAAVVLCFASMPYSKFVHVAFRFAALVRDNAEREALDAPLRR